MAWNFRQFSSKEKIGIVLAVIVLLVAALDRLVVNPLHDLFQQLDMDIKVAEIELGRDLRNVGQKDTIAAEYQNYIQYVQKIGSDEEETAKMLGVIEGLAQKSAVALVEIKPQPVDVKRSPKTYAVEIEATGEMFSIVSLLYGLNTSDQLLRPEKVEIKIPAKDSTVCRVSIRVTRMVIAL